MNSKYKETGAEVTTITYDREKIEVTTQNIYKAIALIAKRAREINVDFKEELEEKLRDFGSQNDSIVEEIFENKEQIEPLKILRAFAQASRDCFEEWLNGKIEYY